MRTRGGGNLGGHHILRVCLRKAEDRVERPVQDDAFDNRASRRLEALEHELLRRGSAVRHRRDGGRRLVRRALPPFEERSGGAIRVGLCRAFGSQRRGEEGVQAEVWYLGAEGVELAREHLRGGSGRCTGGRGRDGSFRASIDLGPRSRRACGLDPLPWRHSTLIVLGPLSARGTARASGDDREL